jgi:FKBP-type peptidyl-prolyl cis-trans isomerase
MEGRMKLKESEEDDEDLDEETEDTEETEETEKETEETEETEEADEAEDGAEETAAAPETDNVGDPSVEINVEELIHEIEAEGDGSRPGRELAAKRRLEDLIERKRAKRELEDFDDYEI